MKNKKNKIILFFSIMLILSVITIVPTVTAIPNNWILEHDFNINTASSIPDCEVSPNGDYLAVAIAKEFRIYQLSNYSVKASQSCGSSAVKVDWKSDGSLVACLFGNKSVYIFDTTAWTGFWVNVEGNADMVLTDDYLVVAETAGNYLAIYYQGNYSQHADFNDKMWTGHLAHDNAGNDFYVVGNTGTGKHVTRISLTGSLYSYTHHGNFSVYSRGIYCNSGRVYSRGEGTIYNTVESFNSNLGGHIEHLNGTGEQHKYYDLDFTSDNQFVMLGSGAYSHPHMVFVNSTSNWAGQQEISTSSDPASYINSLCVSPTTNYLYVNSGHGTVDEHFFEYAVDYATTQNITYSIEFYHAGNIVDSIEYGNSLQIAIDSDPSSAFVYRLTNASGDQVLFDTSDGLHDYISFFWSPTGEVDYYGTGTYNFSVMNNADYVDLGVWDYSLATSKSFTVFNNYSSGEMVYIPDGHYCPLTSILVYLRLAAGTPYTVTISNIATDWELEYTKTNDGDDFEPFTVSVPDPGTYIVCIWNSTTGYLLNCEFLDVEECEADTTYIVGNFEWWLEDDHVAVDDTVTGHITHVIDAPPGTIEVVVFRDTTEVSSIFIGDDKGIEYQFKYQPHVAGSYHFELHVYGSELETGRDLEFTVYDSGDTILPALEPGVGAVIGTVICIVFVLLPLFIAGGLGYHAELSPIVYLLTGSLGIVFSIYLGFFGIWVAFFVIVAGVIAMIMLYIRGQA